MSEAAGFLHAADEIEEGEEDETFSEAGSEIDYEDGDDYLEEEIVSSPLIAAVIAGNLAIAQRLLEEGADKNESTNWGRTVMYHAARRGHFKCVRLLLEQGADKDEADINGETPLYAATQFGHLSVVRLLVQQGADMEKRGDFGSPLHVAATSGRLKTVRYYLEQGADRDKVMSLFNKFTPLHLACINGRLDVVKLLMVYGADLNARTWRGELPIDTAGNEEIAQAIRDEPRRRMDEAPGKRATEEVRHPTDKSNKRQRDDEHNESATENGDIEETEPSSKRRNLEEREAVEGKVAEKDEDSEPSDGEDD